MKLSVIGGDMRHAKLAELLAADGHEVAAFAIDKIGISERVECCGSIFEAVEGADCVILPLPVTSRNGILNAPLSSSTHTVAAVLACLKSDTLVCAGRVDAETKEEAAKRELELIDYFEREELMIANAVATAEGAVQLIMEETPITICGAKCLVIGYGRIGKILAHRLRGLGAEVSVSARKHYDEAWIKAFGYRAEQTEKLEGRLSGFDVVVNTVPFRVLDENRLKELKEGCLCLDLASKPGGMDFTAASRLGIKAVWALSLPGEVAPVTSGMIIRDTIYNILHEKGLMK